MIEEDVMATIKWDFNYNNVHIFGSYDVDSYEQAKKMVDCLNDVYGENTHYAIPHNMTKSEKRMLYENHS